MARIVRHNDESVKEEYVRNVGKEVKLFTSALKAFQCNNRIVMAQRKHLDDFLRGRIIGRQECVRNQLEVSEKLGIAQSVISRLWQRFQDDGDVSSCYSTGRSRVTTPNEDWYLAVTAKRNIRCTASDLSRQLSSATGTIVSRQTVYRCLGHIGLYQCFPTWGPRPTRGARAIRKWIRHYTNPSAPGHLNAMLVIGDKFIKKSKFLNNY
ncbi:HTH_Tnp_Tc3_2 domain-containing protein [Trichonephila clavipes]|nr:HTH_Tnp_Tc3_2 domain-containing protein [Trichonephila clavipes]